MNTAPLIIFRSLFIACLVVPPFYALSPSDHCFPRSTTANSMPASDDTPRDKAPAAAVEFARIVGRLKTTPRTGWVRRGVPRYESVADHSWRVAALSLLLVGRQDLDVVHKLLPMALLHDIGESLVGDIPPEDNVSNDDKYKMEQAAVEKIGEVLKEATGNNEDPERAEKLLLELFEEHEERISKESIAVKDLDLLDMIIQADEYERRFDVDLTDFFESTPVSRFRDPSVTKIAKEIHQQRQERIDTAKETETTNEGLSKNDLAFIAEHSKASNLSAEEVEKVVKAMREWENR